MVIDLSRASDAGRLPPNPLTYEAFLAWSDEDVRAEWVDGQVELMSPVSRPHQALSVFLARIIGEYAERRDAGELQLAPFQMRLPKVRRGREPDLMFVAKAHLGRFRHTFLDGPADLVVEIVSPESRLRDRGDKYTEYEAEGVREYWILDPEQKRADFYVLSADGRYEQVAPDAGQVYRSLVLEGFSLNVGWLWQDPLPPVRQVLSEWEQIQ